MPHRLSCYPLRFEPIIMPKVWGARRLSLLNKPLPPHGPVGESWEVSDHPHGMSVVANGPLAGRSFRSLIQADPFAIAGPDGLTPDGRFLLLFKFLDSGAYTSVQVHPDDAYAQAHESDKSGKTEAWYIVHAEPSAKLIRGVVPGTTLASFRKALREGHVERTLNAFSVSAGDVLYLPAGVLHALGPGVTLAEIQQNSDTTYRIFDWNRPGLDGQARSLALDKALDVIRFDDPDPDKHPKRPISASNPFQENLVTCPMFAMDRLVLDKPFTLSDRVGKFDIVSVLSGHGEIKTEHAAEPLSPGQTFLLPACLDHATFVPGPKLELLWIRRP